MARGRAGEWIGVMLLLAILVTLATWPQIRHLSTGVADYGDPLLNSWTLAWVAHTLPAHPAQLFNANIFFPETGTLAYSEMLIVPALLVAPLLWLGGDPILAHNVLLLLGYAGSGLAMYALVRALTAHRGAAIVAAAVFALYPYRIEQYPKMQLQLVWWIPLALLAIHRLRASPRARTGALAGVLMALQTYSCVYYGIFGVVPLAAVSVATLTSAPGRRLAIGRALAIGLAVWIGLCAPLVVPYRAAAQVVGARTAAEVREWSARPADFLRAHPNNALYGQPDHTGDGEKRLFPGFGAPLLGAIALVPPVSGPALTYLAAAGLSADLALGFNGIGYGALYDWVPGFRAVRVPARFGMFVGLALAVLAGLGIARLSRGRSTMVQALLAAGAVLVVTVESRPQPIEMAEFDDRAPAVYAWLAAQPPGVVCEYPVGNLQGRLVPQDATYMYYSTRHWRPMVNGYSGFLPVSYLELIGRLKSFPDDASMTLLRQRGVRYLLVHNVFTLTYLHGSFEEDIRLLRARSDLAWMARFPWRGGGTTEVFRLRD